MPLGLCLPLSSPQLFGSRRRNYQYTVSRGSRRFSAACSAADRSREQSAGQDDQDEDPLNLHQLTIKRKYEYIQVNLDDIMWRPPKLADKTDEDEAIKMNEVMSSVKRVGIRYAVDVWRHDGKYYVTARRARRLELVACYSDAKSVYCRVLGDAPAHTPFHKYEALTLSIARFLRRDAKARNLRARLLREVSEATFRATYDPVPEYSVSTPQLKGKPVEHTALKLDAMEDKDDEARSTRGGGGNKDKS